MDEGVRATIWLTQEAGCILMRRMGEMTGSLRFQPGERTPGVYSTIYGEIPVAVYTRETEVIRTDNGGEMKLDYDVFVGGERTGRIPNDDLMAAVSAQTIRARAREAIFAAGGRGFVRFLPEGGALLVSDARAAMRRCADAS